jgi:hypothetical protein
MLAEGLEKDKRFAARFAWLYEDPGSEDFGLQQLYSVESRLPDQTIAAAGKKGKGIRRDAVFPEPRERNRQRRKWTVEPYLESAKVPVPIVELAKVKSFRKDMRQMLFDEKDDSGDSSSEEDSPDPRSPAQPAEEKDAEGSSDDESESSDEEPVRSGGRCQTQAHKAGIGEIADPLRVRQMTETEFAEYESKRKTQISPAFKVAAYLGEFFFDEVLIDIGADCNLIDRETANKVVRATQGSYI